MLRVLRERVKPLFVRSARRAATSLLLAIALLALPHLHAQTEDDPAPPPHTPSVTINARLVVLDIVVTDSAGKPIDGLTTKDFQVFEDGKPQRIRSLEPPSAHTLPASTLAAGANAVFDPAKPASFGRSAVTVLVLDQLNTHFADSSFARRELHDFLAHQPALLAQPTTLLTLYDAHFQQLQPFTRNRDLLLKALAAAPTKYAWNLEVNGSTQDGPLERLDQSLRALEQIAQSYAAIPGRKNLVWVGGGFPTPDPASIDGDDALEVKNTQQHVTNVLLDTRVTLYAVDPTSSAAGLTEITDTTQLEVAEATGGTLGVAYGPFDTAEDFDKLGPVTGGRIIRGRNDVAQSIASSIDLGANFYTLAYSPSSSAETSAQYRKIKVVCLRPGLTATTRNGYYSGQVQQAKSAATASYDLSAAAESKVPLNGLHVTVEPDPNPGSSSDGHRYIVRVSAPELTWKPADAGGSIASVYVMAVLYNAKGKQLGQTTHPMKAIAKPDTDLRDPAHQADFLFSVPDTQKAAALRFVVRDSATGRMGSVDLQSATR